MKKFWILKGIKIAVCIVLAVLLFGFIVMKLWNCLMPDVFGLPVISFIQALGLLLLSKILFSGFRPGGGRCSKGGGWQATFMKKRWEKKLASLSPEEREKIKQSYKKYCGGDWCDGDEAPEQTQP